VAMTFRLLLTALSFSSSILAWNIDLSWPKHPEATVDAGFSWSGGVAPYIFEVLGANQSASYYFKYEGAAHNATWDFNLTPGTQVIFQVVDSSHPPLRANSAIVTVIAALVLQYPCSVVQNVSAVFAWGAGLSPYTFYVLTADLQNTYYAYSGALTKVTFPMAIPSGTQIIYQVIDKNSVNVTSPVFTVGSPCSGASGCGPSATTTSTRTQTRTPGNPTATTSRSNSTGVIDAKINLSTDGRAVAAGIVVGGMGLAAVLAIGTFVIEAIHE